MDVARSIQEVTEEVMLKIARHVHRVTGKRNLCLAGGVALNCVGNGKLLREAPFDDIWIQPAAGDAGGAIGAALAAWHMALGNPRKTPAGRDSQKASFLGPSFSDDEIEQYLKEKGFPYHKTPIEDLPARVAELIDSGKVIGWFQGRMEFGPRALGGRSIIGDARSREMQSVMNLKIKFRESFRPFAPTVLKEKACEVFDLDRESPYMLLVADVKKDRLKPLCQEEMAARGLDKLKVARSDVPAVTHVDNSARIQTISREDNSLYYDMIAAFEARTGCPVVINTSFNVRGEPIVCSPEHATLCFMRTNMDVLVMGTFLLFKEEQKALEDDIDWRKKFALD